MSILRFDPFRDLDRLTSQLVSGTRTPALMPMDAWRAGDAYHVVLDLPGIDASSLELTVERSTLTVRAARQSPFGEDDQVLVAERPQGGFTRQLVLGEGVDVDAVAADYTDGVLHLTVPMKQSTQPRRIEVGRGEGERHAVDQPKVIDAAGNGRSSNQEMVGSGAAAG